MNHPTLGYDDIRALSDTLLLESTEYQARRERGEIARTLAHLGEIERRKLHLQRGYSSLFTYAREALKYSESSAARRVAAARLILEFPERLEAIAEGRLTLCAAMEAWRTFSELKRRPEPPPAALSAPLQATLSEQPGLSLLQPPLARSSGVRPPLMPLMPLTQEAKREVLNQLEHRSRAEVARTLEDARHAARGTTPEENPERPRGRISPQGRHWERLELFLSPDERARFDRLRELLSHAHPGQDPTGVFLGLVEEGLERHDPVRKEERAKRRAGKRAERHGKAAEPLRAPEGLRSREPVPAVDASPRAEGAASAERPSVGAQEHCHGDSALQALTPPGLRSPIPAPLRRRVWIRDGGRCRYVDSLTKRRCGARHFLDIDHIVPVAEGGRNELANLRLACASHNRHRARWEQAAS